MVDFSQPATLSQFYDPIRNEQAKEQSGLNALNAVQMKTSIQDSQQNQMGLAMLYKSMAPQKDESGKLGKSPFIDDTGAIKWGAFLNSPQGAEWSQRYPAVAASLMEKAGIMGGGTASGVNAIPINSPEDKARVVALAVTPEAKLAAASLEPGDVVKVTTKGGKIYGIDTVKESSEARYERLMAKGEKNLTPKERSQIEAITKYNKIIKPIPVVAGFVGKENVNLEEIKSTFEKPTGIYKKGENKFTDAADIEFSNALAQGQSLGEFMKSESSSRGIMGTKGQNYLKQSYADWLANRFKGAIKPGQVGAFLAARKNAYKANMATQKKATEFATLNNRAVAQMANMQGILSQQLSALTKSGIRPAAALNAWQKNAINDPTYGKFIVAMNSYLSEYMRVVSGGALSVQQINDSARVKGSELLSTSDNQETLMAKFDVMDQEVQGVKQTWEDAVQTTYGAGTNTEIEKAPATAAPEKGGTATTVPATYTWQ